MQHRGLDFDLDLLMTFWHVHHAGGYTQALPFLPHGLTRGAASLRVKKLEEQMGYALFEHTQKLRLTSKGAVVIRHLDRWFPPLGEMNHQLRQLTSPELRIGSAAAFAQAHWPALLKNILLHEPKVDAEVMSDTEDRLVAAVVAGELQLIIVPLDHMLPASFKRQLLVRLPMVLLVPKDSPIQTAEELKAAKVIPHPVALPTTSCTMIAEMRKNLQRLGLKIGTRTSGSLMDVLHFVAGGTYIGLSLDEPTLTTHPNVRVVPFKTWAPVEIGVVWREPGTSLELRVVKMLVERARELWP